MSEGAGTGGGVSRTVQLGTGGGSLTLRLKLLPPELTARRVPSAKPGALFGAKIPHVCKSVFVFPPAYLLSVIFDLIGKVKKCSRSVCDAIDCKNVSCVVQISCKLTLLYCIQSIFEKVHVQPDSLKNVIENGGFVWANRESDN